PRTEWLPPSPAAPPAAPPSAPAPSPSDRWLPPTDAPPDQSAWWAQQEAAPAPTHGGVPTYGRPAAAGQAAEWLPRVGAALIDGLIRFALAFAFAMLGSIAFAFGETEGEVGVYVGLGIGLVLGLAYAPWMIATRNGQTIGHRAVDTRIVRADGSRVTGGRAFVREVLVKAVLIEAVGGFTFGVLPLLNYLWPLWDERNEALHDKMCETRVVNA
ncbi:MAG TPA: RDD family protein, partial [Solirubrobacteraceae bacterium]|nr:RDD family protein [Solirubrobacteraceae bacterium]